MTPRLRALHHLIDALRWTGLRDRLRCPECGAVGTWKPHGGRFDRDDERHVRRWLCKWCGLYVGPEGRCTAYVDPARGCWTLYEDLTAGELPWTPKVAMEVGPIPKAWPWKG